MARTAGSVGLDELASRLSAAQIALRWRTADRAIHALTRLRFMLPDADLGRQSLALVRDVPYATRHGEANLLDVYIPTRARPRDSGPLPVVMYVHGGGFAMLSKDTHRIMAVAIARNGYLVFNINYRLGPRHLFPAPLEDASEALLWVKENAARYGGDPNRIAIAGESAGGNLVTALAVASTYERPEPFARRVFDANIDVRAVIATYGFLDLGYTDTYIAHPRMPGWLKTMMIDAARSYVGHDYRAGCRKHPLASPLRILESHTPHRPIPPFFISVGTRDPLLVCSRRLKAALDRHGAPSVLHVSPGEIHGYDALTWRPRARAKWEAAHAFLRQHLTGASDEAAA